jgi:hypothetical protein
MHSRDVTPLAARSDVPLYAVCSKQNFPTGSTAAPLPSGRKLSANQLFDATPTCYTGPPPSALCRDTITSEKTAIEKAQVFLRKKAPKSTRDRPAAAVVSSVQPSSCYSAPGPTIERTSVQPRPKPSSEKSLVPVAVKIVDALNFVTMFVSLCIVLLCVCIVFAHDVQRPGIIPDPPSDILQRDQSVAHDHAQPARLFRLKAVQGDADAQFNLGCMYRDGQGVEKDYAEAVRLLRLAAAQGHQRAQFNLGVMFRDGQGVAVDYAEAVQLFRLAAALGHSEAQFSLGVIFENGGRVVRDRADAVRWYVRKQLPRVYFCDSLKQVPPGVRAGIREGHCSIEPFDAMTVIFALSPCVDC